MVIKMIMNKEVYEKAIELWGKDFQILMLIEECAELQQALIHRLRGRKEEGEIVEELADVQIMIEQNRLIFDTENSFDDVKHKKLVRLNARIKSENYELR